MVSAQRLKDGYCLYGGDISGAYYNTPGEGLLILPKNWPEGVGGFAPNETVRLHCAIPGDTLSSGLFLKALSNQLLENDFENVFGATYRKRDGSVSLIHFSDDVLISCKENAVGVVEDAINEKFSIEFEGIERWVSMEIGIEGHSISISTIETANGMTNSSKLFKMSHLDKLSLEGDKVEVPSSFRSAMGKLNYLSTFNPHLRYYVSYLSEAANYDPSVAEQIVESLIYTASKVPFSLKFVSKDVKVIAIYSDANHSLKSLRGHWGCLVQLQTTEEPEPQENVIFWTGGRLAKLYDSVYIAELKASMNSLVEFLKIKSDVIRTFPSAKLVMFSDNKAMVTSLNSDKEVHPFATTYADFCRTACREHEIHVKWCPSAANHADKLTKPTKWNNQMA